jgi:hypothetical protein
MPGSIFLLKAVLMRKTESLVLRNAQEKSISHLKKKKKYVLQSYAWMLVSAVMSESAEKFAIKHPSHNSACSTLCRRSTGYCFCGCALK